jgi:hypothetical protein
MFRRGMLLTLVLSRWSAQRGRNCIPISAQYTSRAAGWRLQACATSAALGWALDVVSYLDVAAEVRWFRITVETRDAT